MKKVVCFLYGNSNNLKLENNATIDEYKKLDENLLKLKEVNDADSLVFSLVTDDSYENVRDTKAVLDDFFVPPISSRKNFFKEGYINDSSIGLQSGGKCGSIMDYICEIKKDNEIPYLVCYFLHKNLFSVKFNAAKNIANELGVEMKVINARFSSKSFLRGTVLDVGPKEFVNLIANACYVCTDSFHGTLFSLLFHKRFSCFDTTKNKHDTRKKGLLERVGATSAFQNIEESIKVCTELDYKKIDRNIEEMRAESISFLQNLKK